MTPLPPHSKEKGFTPEDDQGEGMSEIPADVIEAANAAFKRDEFDNTLIGIVARAILAERKAREADLKKQIHRATNAEYMLLAYRNMLGEKGLEVAKMWDDGGVTRVHFDWGPDAHKMTGEERAAFILSVGQAMTRPVASVDSELPAHPPLTNEAKLLRSKALDELGALDGEERG